MTKPRLPLTWARGGEGSRRARGGPAVDGRVTEAIGSAMARRQDSAVRPSPASRVWCRTTAASPGGDSYLRGEVFLSRPSPAAGRLGPTKAALEREIGRPKPGRALA
jgi:hypothetical protein